MSHPRIEEVSDSDDAASDPSEGDIADFADSEILRKITPKATPPPQQQQPSLFNPAAAFSNTPNPPQVEPKQIANHQCLYPIYFDATRPRAQGRRVPKSLAVQNPLAREIANACAALRLQPVFEPHKTHPQDWANPGRVRVNLRDNKGGIEVKNKHHLYILVARHLQANPTTEHSESLRRVRVPGMALPAGDAAWPRPAVPRGWKVNELLPAYSAAMTGGGVSENALMDMMKEMGAGGGGVPAGMGGMENMMSMFGGGAGPSGGGGAGGGAEASGGGKKGKKGKGKA